MISLGIIIGGTIGGWIGALMTHNNWFSLTSIGIPYAIRASLNILWTFNQSYISPSLRVTRVVDWNSPAFALLVDIKWNEMTYEEARNGMVKLFDSRAASPLDILPNGKSLPEVRNP